MNALARRLRQTECDGVDMSLAGSRIVCDPSGVLYAPDERLLIVSDLHLEKGAAFARRGMMLPPYDTAATLTLLEAALTRYAPQRVISLGDSFHDRTGAALMPEASRDLLRRLMAGRDWIWISGNHDPEPPAFVGGETLRRDQGRALDLPARAQRRLSRRRGRRTSASGRPGATARARPAGPASPATDRG